MEYDKQQEIARLLDLYLAGNTTSEQEAVLRAFFLHETSVPHEMRWAQALFQAFTEEASEKPSAQYSPAQIAVRHTERRNHRRWLISTAIAASIIGAVVLVQLHISHQRPTTVYCYVNGKPVTDYNEAIEQTQEVFALVSKSFGQADDEMASLAELRYMLGKLHDLSSIAPSTQKEIPDHENQNSNY